MLVMTLLIAALVCFLLGAFGIAARVGLTDLGLAFLTGALLVNSGVLA